MDAITLLVGVGNAHLSSRFAEKKMVHSADLRHDVMKTNRDARTQQGADQDVGFAGDMILALDDGDAAHGCQISSPKTRSIFSFNAAGANGLTT